DCVSSEPKGKPFTDRQIASAIIHREPTEAEIRSVRKSRVQLKIPSYTERRASHLIAQTIKNRHNVNSSELSRRTTVRLLVEDTIRSAMEKETQDNRYTDQRICNMIREGFATKVTTKLVGAVRKDLGIANIQQRWKGYPPSKQSIEKLVDPKVQLQEISAAIKSIILTEGVDNVYSDRAIARKLESEFGIKPVTGLAVGTLRNKLHIPNVYDRWKQLIPSSTPKGLLINPPFTSEKLGTFQVRSEIRRIILEEDPNSPLTDAQVAQAYTERTGNRLTELRVTKHRKALGIPNRKDRTQQKGDSTTRYLFE
ncbi:hypothetical protein L0156_27110, partial [bacterium]|nr:hypothetical protein [bacterium]